MVNQTDSAIESGSKRTVGKSGIKSVKQTTPLSYRAQRHQKIMLKKIRECWVNGVLEPSIYQVTAQALGPSNARLRPHNLWPRLIESTDGQKIPVKTVDLVALFYNKSRNIIITGAPGSGKRISLLEVAKLLAIDSRLGVDNFIPIVVPLSSYKSGVDFNDWLCREVKRFYQIPVDVMEEWLSYKLVLPLFEGLHLIPDEQDRARCLSEIENNWLEPNGRGAIVAMEPRDVDALTQPEMVEVITLPPLAKETILNYLRLYGRDLIGLRRTIYQENPVAELAKHPYPLHVMCLAYTDQPHPEMILHQREPDEDPLQGQTEAMFNRLFDRLSTSQAQFLYHPAPRIKHTLRWLADKCAQRNRSDFFLEDLQPSWLDKNTDLLSYTLLSRVLSGSVIGFVAGLFISIGFALGFFGEETPSVDVVFLLELLKNPVMGPIIGVLGGTLIGWWDYRRYKQGKRARVPYVPIRAILYGVVFGLGFSGLQLAIDLLIGTPAPNQLSYVFQGLFAAAAALLAFFLIEFYDGTPDDDIALQDHLTWTWRNAFRGMWRSAAAGLIGGTALLGLLPLVTDQLQAIIPSWSGRFIISGLSLNDTIPINLAVGAIGGLLLGLISGFVRTGLQEQWRFSQILPEQKVRRSLESGLLAGVFVGLGILIFLGTISLIFGAWIDGLWGAVTGLLGVSLLAAAGGLITFWREGGGGFIRHMVLRTVLWSSQRIPFRIAYVLDDGVEILHLYNVGAGYTFTHKSLQTHLRNQLVQSKIKKLGQSGDSRRNRPLFRRRQTPSG